MQLVDTGLVPDVYADCLADVEPVGGMNFRTIYCVYVRSPSGLLEKMVVAKVVRPVDSIIGGISSMLASKPRLIVPVKPLLAH